jgi:hypothetical protein
VTVITLQAAHMEIVKGQSASWSDRQATVITLQALPAEHVETFKE